MLRRLPASIVAGSRPVALCRLFSFFCHLLPVLLFPGALAVNTTNYSSREAVWIGGAFSSTNDANADQLIRAMVMALEDLNRNATTLWAGTSASDLKPIDTSGQLFVPRILEYDIVHDDAADATRGEIFFGSYAAGVMLGDWKSNDGKEVVGIVGPGTSDDARAMSFASLTFNMVSVSYAASATMLAQTPNFFRVAWTNRQQAKALASLIQSMNVPCVTIVTGSDFYSSDLHGELVETIPKLKVYGWHGVPVNNYKLQHIEIASTVLYHAGYNQMSPGRRQKWRQRLRDDMKKDVFGSKATVTIVIGQLSDVAAVLDIAAELGAAKQNFIASDSWAGQVGFDNMANTARGSVGVEFATPNVLDDCWLPNGERNEICRYYLEHLTNRSTAEQTVTSLDETFDAAGGHGSSKPGGIAGSDTGQDGNQRFYNVSTKSLADIRAAIRVASHTAVTPKASLVYDAALGLIAMLYVTECVKHAHPRECLANRMAMTKGDSGAASVAFLGSTGLVQWGRNISSRDPDARFIHQGGDRGLPSLSHSNTDEQLPQASPGKRPEKMYNILSRDILRRGNPCLVGKSPTLEIAAKSCPVAVRGGLYFCRVKDGDKCSYTNDVYKRNEHNHMSVDWDPGAELSLYLTTDLDVNAYTNCHDEDWRWCDYNAKAMLCGLEETEEWKLTRPTEAQWVPGYALHPKTCRYDDPSRFPGCDTCTPGNHPTPLYLVTIYYAFGIILWICLGVVVVYSTRSNPRSMAFWRYIMAFVRSKPKVHIQCAGAVLITVAYDIFATTILLKVAVDAVAKFSKRSGHEDPGDRVNYILTTQTEWGISFRSLFFIVLACTLVRAKCDYWWKSTIPGNPARRNSIMKSFSTMLKKGSSDFFMRNPTGELVQLLVGPSVDLVNFGYTQLMVLVKIAGQILATIIVCGVLLGIPVYLVLIILPATALICGIVVSLFAKRLVAARQDQLDAQTELSLAAQQFLVVAMECRASGTYDALIERLGVLVTKWTAENLRSLKITLQTNLVPGLGTDIFYVVVLFLLVVLYSQGSMSQSNVIAAASLGPRVGNLMKSCTQVFLNIMTACSALHFVRCFFHTIDPDFPAASLAAAWNVNDKHETRKPRPGSSQRHEAGYYSFFQSVKPDVRRNKARMEKRDAVGATLVVRGLIFPAQLCDSPQRTLSGTRCESDASDYDGSYDAGSFDRSKAVFYDLGFEAAPGETVLLIGRAGSGKTTLIDILAGLHGRREVRGTVEAQVGSAPNRPPATALVRSDLNVINGTVRDNIRLGNMDASASDIDAAAALACVSVPLDSMVGDEGNLVGQSETQRICLARALVSKPELLLLDSVTAHQSKSTAEIIMSHLRTLPCTVILAETSPSMINFADKAGLIMDGEVRDMQRTNSPDGLQGQLGRLVELGEASDEQLTVKQFAKLLMDSGNGVFGDLPENVIAEVLSTIRRVTVPGGHVVFNAGEPVRSMCVVMSGDVRLDRAPVSLDEDDGEEEDNDALGLLSVKGTLKLTKAGGRAILAKVKRALGKQNSKQGQETGSCYENDRTNVHATKDSHVLGRVDAGEIVGVWDIVGSRDNPAVAVVDAGSPASRPKPGPQPGAFRLPGPLLGGLERAVYQGVGTVATHVGKAANAIRRDDAAESKSKGSPTSPRSKKTARRRRSTVPAFAAPWMTAGVHRHTVVTVSKAELGIINLQLFYEALGEKRVEAMKANIVQLCSQMAYSFARADRGGKTAKDRRHLPPPLVLAGDNDNSTKRYCGPFSRTAFRGMSQEAVGRVSEYVVFGRTVWPNTNLVSAGRMGNSLFFLLGDGVVERGSLVAKEKEVQARSTGSGKVNGAAEVDGAADTSANGAIIVSDKADIAEVAIDVDVGMEGNVDPSSLVASPEPAMVIPPSFGRTPATPSPTNTRSKTTTMRSRGWHPQSPLHPKQKSTTSFEMSAINSLDQASATGGSGAGDGEQKLPQTKLAPSDKASAQPFTGSPQRPQQAADGAHRALPVGDVIGLEPVLFGQPSPSTCGTLDAPALVAKLSMGMLARMSKEEPAVFDVLVRNLSRTMTERQAALGGVSGNSRGPSYTSPGQHPQSVRESLHRRMTNRRLQTARTRRLPSLETRLTAGKKKLKAAAMAVVGFNSKLQ